MSEFLVGYRANGGFPNKDYLRIEVVEAENPKEAVCKVSSPLWVTEFRRGIPAGMAPRCVDLRPSVTEESVVVRRSDV